MRRWRTAAREFTTTSAYSTASRTGLAVVIVMPGAAPLALIAAVLPVATSGLLGVALAVPLDLRFVLLVLLIDLTVRLSRPLRDSLTHL